MEGHASFVEAAELPAMPGEADPTTKMIAAASAVEAVIDLKRPKMTSITAAAASDYVGIDPFVVLPGERWISRYLNLADFVNSSARCRAHTHLMD